MLSVVDLGIVHRVEVAPADGSIRVEILPTFVGCPALELIKAAIATRLAAFGRPGRGRRDLRGAVDDRADQPGRPRRPRGCRHRSARPDWPPTTLIDLEARVPCPHCGSRRTRLDNAFGPDPVPDHPLLHGLPPAVRSDQARLTMAAPSEPVGIVGAGTMGAGIAQLALEAGIAVWLHDVDAAAIERGRARIRSGLERRATRLDLDPDSADDWVDGRLPRLHDARALDVLAAAAPDLVIEAALEDLGAKRAIFRALDAATPPTVDPRDQHERAVGRCDRRADDPSGSRRSGCISSTRHRSCPSSRSSRRDAADPAIVDRATGADDRVGQGPGSLPGHARASSSTGSIGRSRSKRSRCSPPARRRSKTSTPRCGPRASRWARSSSWTSSGSTSISPQRAGSTPAPSRPAIRPRNGSGRHRSRSASSRTAGSGARPTRASTATRTAVPTGPSGDIGVRLGRRRHARRQRDRRPDRPRDRQRGLPRCR